MASVRPATAQSFGHGARRQKVVREILLGLFTRRFSVGQRMRVERLADQFNVSATPIREALVELAGIGIVELQPNRGAVLRPFGPNEIQELVQVRRILECEAVRTACDRIAPYEYTILEQALQRLIQAPRDEQWSTETRQRDSELHELIASRCGSERLMHEIGRYTVLFRALRDARHELCMAHANYSHMEENAEHLEIVQKLASRDASAASAAMAYHINQSARVLEDGLFGPEATNGLKEADSSVLGIS